jgi:hypothetical protein
MDRRGGIGGWRGFVVLIVIARQLAQIGNAQIVRTQIDSAEIRSVAIAFEQRGFKRRRKEAELLARKILRHGLEPFVGRAQVFRIEEQCKALDRSGQVVAQLGQPRLGQPKLGQIAQQRIPLARRLAFPQQRQFR